jgi:hypothetical protein
MSDLAYWLSMLVWPAGIALIVVAIEMPGWISKARHRHEDKTAHTPAE